MFEGGIDSACHQMGNECFPAGTLEAGTPKRITSREEYGVHKEKGLALAHLVAHVTELTQPWGAPGNACPITRVTFRSSSIRLDLV